MRTWKYPLLEVERFYWLQPEAANGIYAKTVGIVWIAVEKADIIDAMPL